MVSYSSSVSDSLLRLVPALVILVGTACAPDSDDPSLPDAGGPSSTPDAGFSRDGGRDALDAGADALGDADLATCHALVQRGAKVDWVTSTGTPPIAAGGVLADGTYVLTGFVQYSNLVPDGTVIVEVGKATLELRGSTANVLLTDPSEREFRLVERVQTEGTALTSNQECNSNDSVPGVRFGNGTFTATPTKLTILFANPNGIIENTYEKR